MGEYGVKFRSGAVVEVKAKDGDDAKRQAYAIQRAKFPDEPKGHPERQVDCVIHPEE
jgi:hypothetical protein